MENEGEPILQTNTLQILGEIIQILYKYFTNILQIQFKHESAFQSGMMRKYWVYGHTEGMLKMRYLTKNMTKQACEKYGQK